MSAVLHLGIETPQLYTMPPHASVHSAVSEQVRCASERNKRLDVFNAEFAEGDDTARGSRILPQKVQQLGETWPRQIVKNVYPYCDRVLSSSI